ncbi:unnamed protein product [Mytilus coruscus]|uniref:Cyclic GMP-AMP synthase n=1 Tax=Mytilus coruscus TaxID=42192 RepID=A0A6J8DNF3_MYTCO|nr:unnamed protein product [Mytilus coruscus]
MQKMMRMSTEKYESLYFYKYLCQKIGSEEVVKIRRLNSTILDIGQSVLTITSGSKGEGLFLKSSDLDLMCIDPSFKVYESEKDIVLDDRAIPLIMNTEDTQPCFTQLSVPNHYYHVLPEIIKFNSSQKNHLECIVSSEQYKHDKLRLFTSGSRKHAASLTKIHGPCVSDIYDVLDIAFCIKCDKWIFQAQPWSSETLQDYQRLPYKIPESLLDGNIKILQKPFSYVPSIKNIRLLYHFLHDSRTCLSRGLFALHLSKASRFALDASNHCYSSDNKQQYSKYKYHLSHLLISVHSDAVSGWLMLASFFYVHKNYFGSLLVINYALQKYTDEKIYTCIFKDKLNYFQKQELNLMKREKHYTVFKTLTIHPLAFYRNSSIIPQELQLDAREDVIVYNPLAFEQCLSFLCYYHLHDITSCRHYLQQLKSTAFCETDFRLCTPVLYGIALQLMGDTYSARQIFEKVARHDQHSWTSAKLRLRSVI